MAPQQDLIDGRPREAPREAFGSKNPGPVCIAVGSLAQREYYLTSTLVAPVRLRRISGSTMTADERWDRWSDQRGVSAGAARGLARDR
jgi:hypothetical protein